MKVTCPFCKEPGVLADEKRNPQADMALIYSQDDQLWYVECRNCWTIGKGAVVGDEAIHFFVTGKKDE